MGKGVRGVVCGKGINDMEYGWTKVSDWNYKVYNIWHSMIQRCYDEKFHKKNPTYKDCTVCEHWLTLSNFINDIVNIDGFNCELLTAGKLVLDKDIKSNGINKCYCLEQCQFVSKSDNTRQANKTRDYEQFKGEKHPCAVLVVRFDLNGNFIDKGYPFEYVQLGFNQTGISNCCKSRIKTHKGYIFKYISDVSDEQLKEYYESQ